MTGREDSLLPSQRMSTSRQPLDIVNMLLEDCIMAYPVSSFIISIYKQYQQRGWLTKKQLQGLYDKSSRIEGLPPGRLAALEALIKKMPTRQKSELPENKPMFTIDANAERLAKEILEKYPQHKRVLFLQAKLGRQPLLPPEADELKRFHKLLLKTK